MRFLLLIAVSLASQLSGCALVNSQVDTTADEQTQHQPIELIARDFVGAFNQLRSVPAGSTTVDMLRSDNEDAFTLAMLDALRQAGYGVRWVDNESSGTLFQYRQVVEQAAANASRDTYELAVGEIEMRRGYSTDERLRVRPVTPLYVRGTDASGIVLNDDIFEQTDKPVTAARNELQAVRIEAVPTKPLAQIRSTTPPTLAMQNSSTLTVPRDANPLNPLVGKAASPRPLSLPLVALPREENVFDLGSSNFGDVLAGRNVVAEQVLTFANDSMRMGVWNKQLVAKMVQNFDPDTDVFSVIGCSMGPTNVKGGNAALALGRAGRVVEALRFAGVDDRRILDEGCWAGDGSVDNLPRRGVVLTLNRDA